MVETVQESALTEAVTALSSRRVAVLTGAGVSTDSGLPDYRGENSPPRTPMTIDEFLADEGAQRRYWAGSHLGWRRFRSVSPNDGHRAIAELERRGVVTGVATQNVDGLHYAAGSRRVVPVHGTMDRVVCLDCGQVFVREAVAGRIRRDNPWLEEPDAAVLAPDGDVQVADASRFVLPVCTVCGGRLKPEVVFFGELIPKPIFRLASSIIAASDALLIAGSSLAVNSGIRLLEQARRRDLPIVIVNRGATRGDAKATVKLDAGTSPVLTALASRLVGASDGPRRVDGKGSDG